MKILKNQHNSFWLLVSLTLLLSCTCYPAALKIYSTTTECRIAYTQYDPQKPRQTITVIKLINNDTSISYCGFQRYESFPCIALKPQQACALFKQFENTPSDS